MSMVKGFPNIPADSTPGLAGFLVRVREVLEVLLGVRGSKMDKAVTFQDLVDRGIITEDEV